MKTVMGKDEIMGKVLMYLPYHLLPHPPSVCSLFSYRQTTLHEDRSWDKDRDEL